MALIPRQVSCKPEGPRPWGQALALAQPSPFQTSNKVQRGLGSQKPSLHLSLQRCWGGVGEGRWGGAFPSGLSLLPDSPLLAFSRNQPFFPSPVPSGCCRPALSCPPSFCFSSLLTPRPGLSLAAAVLWKVAHLPVSAGRVWSPLCSVLALWMLDAPAPPPNCFTASTLGFLPHTSVHERWSESSQSGVCFLFPQPGVRKSLEAHPNWVTCLLCGLGQGHPLLCASVF